MSKHTNGTNGNDRNAAAATATAALRVPEVDIVERKDEFLVLLDMPGLTLQDIDVTLEKGQLRVTGRPPARHEAAARRLVEEFAWGGFERSFRVGESVDAANVSAHYQDGVLQLRLPKSQAARPRTIEVRGS